MASYTDNLNILTSHPQYVSQLPVEAMTQVGVAKQQAYNEGIQRIQSSIDSVAGLDVSKDIHKQYLQSKLNELGGKLKTVAAGDFSNFQLVNNVMGMTNQIVKDPVIQNAVYSTQVIRKGQQELDKAKQDGKSSPQNEAFWSKQIADWQNDGDLNTRFNGSYIAYTDVGKKLREVADKIHEIDSSIDIPFQRDSSGNVLTDSSGKPLVDTTMLEIKTKGKPASKLLSNFMSSLDENDQRQLGIDSWYHYRGLGKDDFKREIVSGYNAEKTLQADKQKAIALELQTNGKLSDADKAKLQAQLTDVTNSINSGRLEKELDNSLRNLNDSNLDSYKYNVYTKKYLSELAQNMSYQSYEQAIKTNPYFQADMEMKRYNLQVQQMLRAQSNADRAYGLDVAKFQYQMQKDIAEQSTSITGPTESKPLPIPKEGYTIDGLNSDITKIDDEIEQLNTLFGPSIGADKLLKSSQKDLLNGMLSEFNINPKNIKNPEVASYLFQRRELELKKAKKLQLFEGAQKASAKTRGEINNILEKEPPLSLSSGMTIPAKDLYEVLDNFSTKFNTPSTQGYRAGKVGSDVYHDYTSFIKGYSDPNKRVIAEALAKMASAQPLTNSDIKIVNRAVEVNGKFNEVTANLMNQARNIENAYLTKNTPTRFQKVAPLDITNPKAIKVAQQAINAALSEFHTLGESDKGKVEYTDFNPETLAKFISNKNSDGKESVTLYRIEKDEDSGEGFLILENSGEIQRVPLNKNRLKNFFPEAAITNPYNEIFRDASFGIKTTNFNSDTGNPASAISASITGRSAVVPNLNNTPYADRFRFEVRGAPNNDGSDYDQYLANYYFIDDNDNWNFDTFTPYTYVNKAGIQTIFQDKLGPATAQEIAKKYNSNLNK